MSKSRTSPLGSVIVPSPVSMSTVIVLPPGSVNEQVLAASSMMPSGGQPIWPPPGPPGPPPPMGISLPCGSNIRMWPVSMFISTRLPAGSLMVQMSPSIVASGGHSWGPPGKKPPPGPPGPPCGPCIRKSSMRPSEWVTVPAPVARSNTIALPAGSVNEHVLVSSSTVPSGGQPGAPPGPPGPPPGPPISFMLNGSTRPSEKVMVPSIVSRL